VETERDLLLVDCGLLFPRAEQPGVAYRVPDFQILSERRHKLRGVLVTHGHEDHIGALPHLLRDFPVPVYGTRFTTALVHRRLSEVGCSLAARLRTVAGGAEVVLGGVRAQFLPVAHSIPDACAVALETPGGGGRNPGSGRGGRGPIGPGRVCRGSRSRRRG
jgi:ribonuclease J